VRGQREALEAALNGESLETSLGVLVRTAVDGLGRDTRAAFYLANGDGTSLHHVVGMPDAYAAEVDGFAIGPESLACGLASHTGRPVLTEDVRRDARWEPWLWLAERFDYRGCWSIPLHSATGRPVGTFAIYTCEPREASERDLDLVSLLAYTASMIVSRQRESEARRQAEQALRERTAELEENGRRKDLFLATLGHELRNPLAGLEIGMRLLRENQGDRAALEQLLAQDVDRLKSLVNDLLELSRIRRGKLSIHAAPMDLSAAVVAVIDAARPQAEARSQSLAMEVERDVRIRADATRIAQVVENLLSNALKFTPNGGSIRVTLRADGTHVELCVADDGRGIPAGDLASIFEPFTQSDPEMGGLGIGLPLARGLVALHGGTLEAQSPGLGRGSTFRVRIPRGRADETARASSPIDRALPSELRVAIADDERDYADSLALYLRSLGCQAVAHHDGEALLRSIAEQAHHVVLLDLGMPGLSGYALAERIRRDGLAPGAWLLAVTGFGDVRSQEKARAAGFDRRLVKPLDLDQLHELLLDRVEHGL
jgi:signal transduction histidine kinase/CheY-like chemotaxis protein